MPKHGEYRPGANLRRMRYNGVDKEWIEESVFIAKFGEGALLEAAPTASTATSTTSARTKPSWWSADVAAIGGYTWDYLSSNAVTTANYRAFITSIQNEMRGAGYKLIKIAEGNFAYVPVPPDERVGREWTGEGAEDAAIKAAADTSAEFPDEPPWKKVPLGDEVWGIRQTRAEEEPTTLRWGVDEKDLAQAFYDDLAPEVKALHKIGFDANTGEYKLEAVGTTQRWGTKPEADAALDTLSPEDRATHISKYDPNTGDYKHEPVTTYGSLAAITTFLGDDFTGDPDGTGRFIPRQKSIAGGAPTISAMRQMMVDAGLNPFEHEIYEDYGAPTNQMFKIRALSPSSGRRFTTFAEAEATLPAGFEVQGYIWEGDQYYKHVRSAPPEDEDIDKIETFDELVYAVALTQGGAAALAVDAFRDRVNRPQMSFGAAAQLALQYGKNSTQMKNIMTMLLEPPGAFDTTAFDEVMANAGSALAGTSWASVSDVANQFETGAPLPGGGMQTDALLAGSGGEAWNVPAPVSAYQGAKTPSPTGRYEPRNQEEIDAMVAAGNDWWNFNERDQTWLATQTGTQVNDTIVTPDGVKYKNVGSSWEVDEAGNPIFKPNWEKVIAEPVTPAATSTAPLTTKSVTDTPPAATNKIDEFMDIFSGDKYEDKDKLSGKHTVGTGRLG